MAASSSWTSLATRQRDVGMMEYVEQLLRGGAPAPVAQPGHQQRSMSSGRHPRLGASSAHMESLGPGGAGPAIGGGDTGTHASGRSPRPRSASVGRRQQEIQELASVMQELNNKGRIIQNIGLLQDLPTGPSVPFPAGAPANVGASNAGYSNAPTRSNLTAGAGAYGGIPGAASSTSIGALGGSSTSISGAMDARGFSSGSVSSGIRGGRGASTVNVGGGSASGKMVTRSILGGVESLASKMEMLGDRSAPRKASPHTDYHRQPRDSSSGQRNTGSAGSGGAPNYRDLLAAASAGLTKQGTGLQDAAHIGRDQRPGSAAGPSGSAVGSSTAVGGGYASAISAELAANVILQNRRRTSEDIMAADRALQTLQSEIRASAGGAAPPPAGPVSGTTAAAAAAGGGGAVGAELQALAARAHRSEAGSIAAGEASLSEAIAAVRRRSSAGLSAATVAESGMMSSFLASLSEALSPPRSSAGGPDSTPTRPDMIPQAPQIVGMGGSYANSLRASQEGGFGTASRRSDRQDVLHHNQHHQSQRQHHGHSHHSSTPQRPASAQQHEGRTTRAESMPAAAAERMAPGAAPGIALSLSAAVPMSGGTDERLTILKRLTKNVARDMGAPEPESSTASAGSGAGAAGWPSHYQHQTASYLERRDGPAAAPAWRDGNGSSSPVGGNAGRHHAAQQQHQPQARPRSAWAEDGAPGSATAAAAAAAGSSGGALGSGVAAAEDARKRRHSVLGGASGGSGGGQREALPPAYPAPPAAGSQGAAGPTNWSEPDGLNMELLMQQRRKEKARRDEQEAAEALTRSARARQQASDWQAQHDTLMTQHLAVRQRLQALEAEHERIAKEGCGSCARWREQAQQASDTAANTLAQLREVQAQLQEARAAEDAIRRQLDHTTTAVSEQAAVAARFHTKVELALQEFLDLATSAAPPSNGSGGNAGSSGGNGASGPTGGSGPLRSHPISGRDSGAVQDLDLLLEALRLRLREQNELSRRQRQLLETAQEQLEQERAVAVATREDAAADRADAAVLTAQELGFLRERSEVLQEELARQRELGAKMELKVRQLEAERDRAVRQREAAELSLQAQQAQLEAAQQQQNTLVGRLYDGQRAREDAEVLQAQIRSLTRQLEEARNAAGRSEQLERKVSAEREAREEVDARVEALHAQVAEREAVVETFRRRVRELETALNSAVVARQAAMDQSSSRGEELNAYVSENKLMFQHLETLQNEKRNLDAKVKELGSQVRSDQQEAASLRAELGALREQLAALKDNQPIRDATLAQQQLSGELASSRSEAGALRAAHETAAEYAHSLARILRRHGLPVPEAPSSADVASQIGTLQNKLAAEEDAAVAARAEVSELRQHLGEARAEVERLKREVQNLTERYSQLEAAHASSQVAWQQAAEREAASLSEVSRERDALRLELHQLQMAGNQDAEELRRKVARLDVQVDVLSGGKREAEERAKQLAADLGALRKNLADNEAQMESLRLSCEAAQEAAARASQQLQQAEKEKEEAVRAKAAAEEELEKLRAELGGLQSELDRLEKEFEEKNAEYAGLYDYCGSVIGERDALLEERSGLANATAAAEAEVAELRGKVEELREDLADKERRLEVKPKMAELQYRLNELAAQLADVTSERDTAVAESNQTAQKLQDEQEAHFETDGRRVRLGEEVERLRGILRMYSIPF